MTLKSIQLLKKLFNLFFYSLNFLSYCTVINTVNIQVIASKLLNLTLESIKLSKRIFNFFVIFADFELVGRY